MRVSISSFVIAGGLPMVKALNFAHARPDDWHLIWPEPADTGEGADV